MGSHTAQRPLTSKSQPPLPQTSEEGQASAGLWQFEPVPPFSSLQLYMSQLAGQQREGSQVPGTSGILLGTHVSPAAQRHGCCVNPPHGPSSFETHVGVGSGTHWQRVLSKCDPRMQRTFCTHCGFFADVIDSVIAPELDDPSVSVEPPHAEKSAVDKRAAQITFDFIPSSSRKRVAQRRTQSAEKCNEFRKRSHASIQ
jgi:hypothetical protein